MRSRLSTLLMVCGLALLAGCATPGGKSTHSDTILTPDTILKPAPSLATDNGDTGIKISSDVSANKPPPKPEIEVGTAKFYKAQPAAKNSSGEGQVTFNFEDQPIQAVVKAILGDMLQENYTIAPSVGGNVTYSTARPIRRQDAMPVLEMLLAWTGNALVLEGGRYTVLQRKDAIAGKLSPHIGASQVPGYGLRIFPLKYISASEMAKLLKPYAKPDAFVSIDPDRSLLVLAGDPSELDNYQRTIDTFDVDWLKGMSIGVFTLQHVDVTKLMPDLDKIFGSKGESPLAGMFRFMPIEETNAMIVITPQPEYLRQAEEWLYRLDRGGTENSVQLYVYNVKNLQSTDLADYLSEIFLGTTGTHRSSTSGRVGQGLRSTSLSSMGGSRGSSMGGGMGGGSSMNYGSSLRPQSNQEKSAPVSAGATAAGGKKETDIRISSIDENNQLMIQATPIEWDRIEAAIRKLDVVPLQVQIEARILEVTLDNALSYGVQWYLQGLMGTATGSAQANGQYPIQYSGNRWNRHRLELGATGNVTPTNNGGFFYSFLNKKFEVAINALQTNGQAKSLAAPSLLVMNNQEAQINVGQQIPVQQTYFTGISGVNSSTGTNVGSGFGSVQYLNTGVILDVKPRVNPGGLIYLDIQQEVSNPGNPGTPGGNPPINQRQIQTQVAVQSGQTLMLGGLIQDNQNDTKTGLPLINKIPLLRDLFGSTSKTRHRTELIVLITPRVISSVDEGRQATLDYTRQFESLTPLRVDDQTPPPALPPSIARPPSDTTPPSAIPPPQPAETHPIPDNAKPQEELQHDH